MSQAAGVRSSCDLAYHDILTRSYSHTLGLVIIHGHTFFIISISGPHTPTASRGSSSL